MSNSGDQGHTWKRLKIFAELLGPNFDHEDESRLLAAFQDFVYFMNFGWDRLESLLQDQSQPEEENQSVPGHESSFDCDGNDIYVEDILNICIKLKRKFGEAIPTDGDWIVAVAVEASPVFVHGVATETWIQTMAMRGCFNMPSLGFGSRHGSVTTIPGMLSSSKRIFDTNICDECFVSMAKRAGCISLNRDCYEYLRKISRNYVCQVLQTAFNSLKGNCRDLLMAREFQEAIISSSRHVICGYGFKGMKRAFFHEILEQPPKLFVHPECQIDFTATEVVSDMLCHLFDKLLQTTPRTASSEPRLAVPAAAGGINISNNTLWTTGPAMIIKTKNGGGVKTRSCVVEQLITLQDIQAGLEKVMCSCEQLFSHALKHGTNATVRYCHPNSPDECLQWGDGKLISFCNDFIPENVAILAKEWYDTHFEDEALIFTTAVLEYICAEIMEMSSNTANENSGSIICSRDVLLAVENDAELFLLFRECVLRDGGSVSKSSGWRDAWVDNAVRLDVDNESVETDPWFHESSWQALKKQAVGVTAMDDPFTGFPVLPLEHGAPLQLNSISHISSGISRRTRRNNAVLRAWNDDPTRHALMKEIPLDASPHALESLNFTKLRNAMVVSERLVAANICPDIPRIVLKNIITALCLDPEFADHKVWKFTHEAVNVLQLGLERYLLDLLRDACGKVVAAGLAMVEPSHIMDAVKCHQMVMAAAAQNRERVAELLQEGATIDCTFNCDSAIMMACDNDDTAFMEWLIKHGANVNMKHETLLAVDYDRPNCVLLRAIQEGRFKVLSCLLQRFSDMVDFTAHNRQGQNALMLYVKRQEDDPDMIEWLASQRGIDINAKDGKGRTAFQLACREEHNGAEKLILLGAEVGKECIGKLETTRIIKKRLLAAIDAVATPGLK